MDHLVVSLELPRDLLGALDVPQEQLKDRLQTLIAVALVQEGKISTGKGAEVLGVSKLEFIKLLSRHGINYFTESQEELDTEVETLKRLLQEEQL